MRGVSFKHYVVLLVAGCLAIAEVAPRYLTYNDAPGRSDAIILFVGAGNTVREDKARELMAEGFSQHLIIPAFGNFFRFTGDGQLEMVRRFTLVASGVKNRGGAFLNQKVFENTHLEMLTARKIVDEYGFRSAILVSEPYHMRRIKLIAGRVFGQDAYRLTIVPTTAHRRGSMFWWLNKDERRWIVNEYLKILWFILYEPFIQAAA